jgi:ligand-binding sensor protein
VFSGVNSDSGHSDFGQSIKVTGHDVSNVFRGSVLISQQQKPTIAHVVGVLIGIDVA